MATATFDVTFSSTRNAKNLRGKIFDIRAFAERKIPMTAADVREAVKNFVPVPLDLEHRETMLSGKLGTLQSVEYNDATGELFGIVEEAAFLGDVLGDTARRVSTTWDTVTKRLIGLAYTLTPHVEDAAVAAFSKTADPNAVDWAEVNRALVECGFPPKYNERTGETLANRYPSR